jgi:alkanesulfonate monooxygenase SsuD/methylene tetrahydromethanopterin reductase-like flavin-dependent oxidoreductase (luciferase family)
MHLMYFTEQPMAAYDAQEGLKYGATALTFSNKHYNSMEASRLYNEYLEEYILAEECGADGIMLNEHHNAPFCMQARTNMFGAILAAVTKRVKIVFLGNPLPLSDNPVQLSEELAMIDMISKGRLVSGFVRGGGQEQLANGVNPAFNRERFIEAHDLIQKIWTEPGPFRWEGTHYQHRVVNPWALPMQKPYPRVWVPGVLSKETVIWTAQQRYPYIALNTSIAATTQIRETYAQAAAEVGYTAGPENFGYLIRVHVQDTMEKALQNARQFMWMQGEFTGLAHPVWANPSGYFSPSGRRAFVQFATGRAKNPRGDAGYGDPAVEVVDRANPAGDHGDLGERWHGVEGGSPPLHRIVVPGGDARGARAWCQARVEGPVGGECAGASAVFDRHPGAAGGGGVGVVVAERERARREPLR